MAEIPFIGPSYVYRTKSLDAQRSINLYTAISENPNSADIGALIGTPGRSLFVALPNSVIRGSHEVLSRGFIVAGEGLYEILEDNSYVFIDNLDTNTGNVSMSDNGLQLVIVDGPNGYIVSLENSMTWPDGTTLTWPDNPDDTVSNDVKWPFSDTAFTTWPDNTVMTWPEGSYGDLDGSWPSDVLFEKIEDPDFVGADTVTFSDGYFIFNKPDSGIYYISQLYEGRDIDSLEFASAESSTDLLIAVIAVQNRVWLVGSNSIDIVYNSGALDFPYTRVDVSIDYGTAAPFSVAKLANTVILLGNDKYGDGTVWMFNGFQPERISTDAVESAIQSYSNISDAVAHTYQEGGQHFYILNFPTANTTWAYEIRTKMWHERAYQNAGTLERDRAQTHMFLFRKHLVGDYQNGNVYEQDLDIYTDNGDEIYRERTLPYLSDKEDLNNIYFKRFELVAQTGVGLSSSVENDANPKVALSWSDDDARTWSNEHVRSLGKIGERVRLIWNRLGRARRRVFKVVTTAKCKIAFTSAYVLAEKGDE